MSSLPREMYLTKEDALELEKLYPVASIFKKRFFTQVSPGDDFNNYDSVASTHLFKSSDVGLVKRRMSRTVFNNAASSSPVFSLCSTIKFSYSEKSSADVSILDAFIYSPRLCEDCREDATNLFPEDVRWYQYFLPYACLLKQERALESLSVNNEPLEYVKLLASFVETFNDVVVAKNNLLRVINTLVVFPDFHESLLGFITSLKKTFPEDFFYNALTEAAIKYYTTACTRNSYIINAYNNTINGNMWSEPLLLANAQPEGFLSLLEPNLLRGIGNTWADFCEFNGFSVLDEGAVANFIESNWHGFLDEPFALNCALKSLPEAPLFSLQDFPSFSEWMLKETEVSFKSIFIKIIKLHESIFSSFEKYFSSEKMWVAWDSTSGIPTGPSYTYGSLSLFLLAAEDIFWPASSKYMVFKLPAVFQNSLQNSVFKNKLVFLGASLESDSKEVLEVTLSLYQTIPGPDALSAARLTAI